jgi:hypothetical protein
MIFDVKVGLVPLSWPAFEVEVEREISGTTTKSFDNLFLRKKPFYSHGKSTVMLQSDWQLTEQVITLLLVASRQ